LGCLVVLESLASLDNLIDKSPFFPVLVQHILALLHSHHQSEEDDPSKMEQTCLLELLESLLPSVLGCDTYDALLDELKNDGSVTVPLMGTLEECMKKWIVTHTDDDYISPLILVESDAKKRELKHLQKKCRSRLSPCRNSWHRCPLSFPNFLVLSLRHCYLLLDTKMKMISVTKEKRVPSGWGFFIQNLLG
jgi:hypothetical protein